MATDPRQLKREAMVFKAMAHPSRLAVWKPSPAGSVALRTAGGGRQRHVHGVAPPVRAPAGRRHRRCQARDLGVLFPGPPCVMTFLECLRHPEESSGCPRCAGDSAVRRCSEWSGAMKRRNAIGILLGLLMPVFFTAARGRWRVGNIQENLGTNPLRRLLLPRQVRCPTCLKIEQLSAGR